ncbi:hypothetical protein GCM10025857_24320 [Alicyclobacillus contaminans]|uniref:hypothetical protein n=1 Tax=Alicyclobacillus contaminans TaxID=392016 RepID=UPI000416A3C7|nr:hypothetical protein [Alicyclobacillus contaminans]GMA51075.1 hypothetical protein GCM10025857_24320 [Alicyclobacillus contaminans]
MRNKKHLRRAAAAGMAALLCAAGETSFANAAQAPAGFHPVLSTKTVSLNGNLVSSPKGFSYQGTSYLPVYYVMHALDSIGIHSTWNGSAWHLQVPSGIQVDLSQISVGSGDVSIYINNTLVKRVYGLVYPDPASGKPTTYLPIWYAMGVFQRMGITPSWDGTHWNMKQTQTAPEGPADTTVQASTIPGAVSKEKLVADFAAAVGATATVPSSSPYDDVPTSDPNAGAVLQAVSNHWITPFSASHFGAGDVVTLQDADQLYWNYLKITDGRYQPGQTWSAWADDTELTNGVQQTEYLMADDEQKWMANLTDLLRGYSASTEGTATLRYTPEEEYAATFSKAVTATGTPVFTSTTDIQTAIVNTYRFFNSVTVQYGADDVTVRLPLAADGTWFVYGSSTQDVSYSLDGGASWTTADVFDSTRLSSRPSSVLVRAASANGLWITYNKLVPAIAGSVALGMVHVWVDPDGSLRVARIPV